MSFRSDLPRVLKLLDGERRSYAIGLFSLLLVNASDVVAPLFLAMAVDLTASVLTGRPPQTSSVLGYMGLSASSFSIGGAVAVFFGLQVVANLARYPMLIYTSVPSHRIGQRIRNQLIDHLLRLSRGFFDRAKSGDLMSLQTNDVIAIRMMLGPGILVGSDTLILVTLVIIVMFLLSWQLALLALIPMPLLALITNKLSHAEYNRSEAVQNDIGVLTERVRESYAGIRIVQGYAREAYDLDRFTRASYRHYLKNLALGRVRSVFDPSLDFMLGASTAIVLAFGGPFVVRGEMSIGTFTAFLFLINFLSGPMVGFGWAVSLWQRGRASLKRLDAVLAERPDVADAPGAVEAAGPFAVEVRDLTFSYPPRPVDEGSGATPADARPALEGISFSLPPGRLLGVTGPVGSGKSTLASLLTRIYEPPVGAITVDGVELHQVRLEALRRGIVVAPQDTFLFSDTIENNVLMGVELGDASPAERQARARALTHLAALDAEIDELPKGYQTLLGERGVNLSGGQRQRVAIARAIGADPRLLVLDDCLSAVDARTEAAILGNLSQVFAGRSGVIISHRVRALAACDEILVLEQGRIVERGTHASLLAADGYYARIAREQTREDADDEVTP
jgi:ATP-binding cassette subfamily B protein